MSKNGAEVLAQELLDMQEGSVWDARMLLEDSGFSTAVFNAVDKKIHELGDASNCECGSEYDRPESPYVSGVAMMHALDDIHYFESMENTES